MKLEFYPAPERRSSDTDEAYVVVPGNFDGVHLGHRALIAHAKTLGPNVCALTFDPHPLRLLAPEKAPGALTSLKRKIELLIHAGADVVAVACFDRPFSELSATRFVSEIFVDALRASHVIVGEDFRFGYKREGDIQLLRQLARQHNFSVQTMPHVAASDAAISSTRVRQALVRGDLNEVTGCLGRGYDLDGAIVHGQARGRTIGFPTANFALPAELLPAHGVYAVIARDLSAPATPPLRGVANLGVRPTISAGLSLEANFFDVDPNLYDHTLRLAFVRRIRDEMRFESLDALKAQIERDVAIARAETQTLPGWHTWL